MDDIIDHIDTVEAETSISLSRTRNCETPAKTVRRSLSRGKGARYQHRQLLELAAIQGQFDHSFVFDHPADVRRLRLHQGCSGTHDESLIELSYLHVEVDRGPLVDLQDKTFANSGLEAG